MVKFQSAGGGHFSTISNHQNLPSIYQPQQNIHEIMKAKCIKADPLDHLEIGKIYEVKEYPRNFGVFEDGRLLMGFSKENFYQHFRPIWTQQ